ncbi:dihydrofolate reductase [Candidatus Daviesbacteria bacterium]|nr:dihydrofolate reductase [Candidatus Daviesbacteria bacterium]
MKKIKISAIVAIDEKRGIGKNNQLLFHIKEDFERMHKIIAGHPLIMGRKTHDSIGRVIPGAPNFVITRDPEYKKQHTEGCIVVSSVEEALEKAKASEHHGEIFIFGGGEIYKQAMPVTDKIYLTLVKGDFGADTFFPDYSDFKKVVYQSEEKESIGLKYKFIDLEK